MKKSFCLFILIIILLMTVSCQPTSSTADPSSKIKVSGTVTPSPANTLTVTLTQSSANIVTSTPSLAQGRQLPTVPISIENASLLEPFNTLGDQYIFVTRGFRTLLFPTFEVYAMVENPEATAGELKISLRDVATGAILHTIIGDPGKEFSSAFSPDGRFFAVGNDQGLLSVWEVNTGKRILHGEIEKFPNLPYSRRISSIIFSPDSNLVVTSSYSGRLIGIWDLNLGRRIRAIYCANGDACIPLAFSPDGQYFVTQEDDHIDLFDGQTGSFLRRFAPDDWVITAYAFSPTGDLLAVIDRSPSLSIYKFPEGKLVTILDSDPALDMASVLSFSPDGKILANSYNTGSFALWNVESRQIVFRYTDPNYEWHDELGELHYSEILTLTFSPDGTILASRSGDNSVTLWSIP